LKPVDREVAEAAMAFGAKYRLRAADAIHLATAVVWGAERFHTNNRRDFGPHVTEVEVVHPDSLVE
jgi:predicted nucleic acid-binding protein